MRGRRGIAIVFFACAATGAVAQTRAEIPIKAVTLSNGDRRYTVAVTIGATTVEAGLDTGSTGLRILPRVLAPGDAKADGISDSEAYGAGTRISGTSGHATVTIGALSAPIGVQLIEKTDCVARIPDCPASRIPIGKFGMQGDGLPGEGFGAIIGINMAEAEIASPLAAIGARRWIVELPRGDAPGTLVLNPGDDEIEGFTLLPLTARFQNQRGGLHDALSGCLINAASHAKACGAILLDTGAPGIRVANSDLGEAPWPQGTAALLGFDDAGGPRIVEALTVGLRSHASHLSFVQQAAPQGTVIFAGLSPYFAFDVLYDPAAGRIGLKPRPPAPGAPRGELAPAGQGALE